MSPLKSCKATPRGGAFYNTNNQFNFVELVEELGEERYGKERKSKFAALVKGAKY